MYIHERIELVENLNREVAEFLGVPERKITIDVEWPARNTYGRWNSLERKLQISKFMVNDEEIRNTILHELCHVYCREHGHGSVWQSIAKRVGNHFGTVITRTSSKEMSEKSVRLAVGEWSCPKCGAHGYDYRRSTCYQLDGKGCTCGRCHSLINYKRLR